MSNKHAAVPLRARSGLGEWSGWPYIIVGLAVVLRLAHIWNSRSNPTFWAPAVDPLWYDQAAIRIVQGDWGPFPFFRTPTYPMLLAAVYSIFGHDLFAARVLNVVLQGATTWMIWWVGRSYFSNSVGILSAALFALNGMAIYFACELVPPSIEMLAAVLCAWATFRLTRDLSLSAVAVCGLSYGLAAIIRPNFLFIFPVALAVVFLLPPKLVLGVRGLRFAASRGPIWLLAAFLPILPITVANVVKGGEFALIATQGGVNFWIGNNPESTGALAVLPGYGNNWEIEDAQMEASRSVGHKVTSGEMSTYYFNKGWQFIRERPALAIKLMIRKAALFFNQYEISNNKHISYFSALSPWLPALIRLNFAFLVPLGALGCLVLWRQGIAKILFALILLYAASVILFFVTARFRMPVVPWLSWLAAGGIVWIVSKFRVRFSVKQFAPLLILIPVGILTFMDIWRLREPPDGWARFMEGNAYMRLQQNDSARVAFLDAIRDQQEVTFAYLNLGVIAYRENNLPEAQRWYEEAIRSDSTHWKAWNNYGTIRESQGDTTTAIIAYKRALKLNPAADDARVNLAGTYFRFGVKALKENRDSLAIAFLDSSIALRPDPISYYNRALGYARLDQPEKARMNLSAALALDPNLVIAPQLQSYLRSPPSNPPTTDSLP